MHSQVGSERTNSALPASVRLHYLDWLRVLAILTVFIFHCGRFFDEEGWHVKNPTTYFGVEVWTYFLVGWIMPLIFAISGASIFCTLRKGRAGRFVGDRALRLLVPLVVGSCTHVALQVYFEARAHALYRGPFLAWLPRYFHGWREFGGNFAWYGLHLWYLGALFVFSLVFLPLFLWLKEGSGRRFLVWLGGFLSRPGAVYLLAVPGTLLIPFMDPAGLWTRRDWGGWGLPLYIPFFLAGFVVVSHEGLQARIRRQRWFSLAAGTTLFVILLVLAVTLGDPAHGTAYYSLFFGLFSLFSWCLVLAILGFGMQHLTFSTPFLRYANEAVLPFYILHQTVIISVGYYVVRWPIPDLLKFVLIAASSFSIIMLLYEFLIRRFKVLRFLFGMKPRPRPPAVQPQEAIGTLPSA
jgi:glucans biosynthesis protein C